ncbi:hypothetical protein NL676_033709 [Syzygium grande]|nr:hypothetical protein NL676_033709 [Syzygium grande]
MNKHCSVPTALQQRHPSSRPHRFTEATPSKDDEREPPREKKKERSAAEAVQGPALPLEGVHVHGGDGLPAGVLGVGHGVADHVLQEDLQHPAGLLVDQAADALHAAPAGQTPDRRLRDALDVVAQHLPVPLRAALAQPLASLPSEAERGGRGENRGSGSEEQGESKKRERGARQKRERGGSGSRSDRARSKAEVEAGGTIWRE